MPFRTMRAMEVAGGCPGARSSCSREGLLGLGAHPSCPSLERAVSARDYVAAHRPLHGSRCCKLAVRAGKVARGRRLPVLLGVRPGWSTHCLSVRCTGFGARTPHCTCGLVAVRLLGAARSSHGGAIRGVKCCLAPSPLPWFVAGCARCLRLRQPVAVVARHLSVCRGCDRRHASLAFLMAPCWCAAPRPVRLLSVHRSRRRCAFPY